MAMTKEAMQNLALGRGGSYGLDRDALKHQVWDTRYFGTTISDWTFFSQQKGSPWRNSTSKTLNETNMEDASKLPAGQTFLIERINVSLISAFPATGENGADVVQAFVNILQSSVFTVKIAGREYDFILHGSTFTPSISVNCDTGSTGTYRHGDNVVSGWVSLMPTPIYLENLVTFNVIQTVQNPDSNVKTVLDAAFTLLNGLYSTMTVKLEGFQTKSK